MCTVWQGNQLLYSALLGYSRFHRNLVRTENPHFYFKAALRDSASSQSHSPLNNPREILKPNTRWATLVHNWYSQGVCFKVCCRIQKCPKDLTNSCVDPVEKGGQVREKGLAWGISLGSGIPTTWKDFQVNFIILVLYFHFCIFPSIKCIIFRDSAFPWKVW